MDFNTTFDGRKCDHTTRIPLCCKTPLERTLGELPCLCSAQSPNVLVTLSVSRAVQAICAERSASANNDGDGDAREKARTADGGTFARLCVRGRRKVCRAQLENILDVQRRSDTTFPIRTVHSTCMYSNATSASAQLACNMTVQHVQVCREMRWPRPSHDSWPRHIDAEANSEKEKKAEIVGQPNGLFCLQKLHSYLENVDLEAIRKLMKLYRIDCSPNPAFGNILGGRSHCVKQNAKLCIFMSRPVLYAKWPKSFLSHPKLGFELESENNKMRLPRYSDYEQWLKNAWYPKQIAELHGSLFSCLGRPTIVQVFRAFSFRYSCVGFANTAQCALR